MSCPGRASSCRRTQAQLKGRGEEERNDEEGRKEREKRGNLAVAAAVVFLTVDVLVSSTSLIPRQRGFRKEVTWDRV